MTVASGVAEAARWYLALAAVGAGALLPSALLFSGLRSGGVLYARPLALLMVAYAAWLASTLGVAPYGTGLVLAAAALLWAWSGALAWRRPALLRALWRRRTILIAGEALFIVLFALILVVRAQAPAARDTEKPMDLALLTAVHRADQLPPRDPWFAGGRVSYYHLGHTSVDASARLAGVDVGSAFTLGVASAGALAGAAVFALGGDLLALSTRRRRASAWAGGAVATVSLLFLSTLEGPIELLAANGLGGEGAWGWLGVQGLPDAAAATRGVPDGWWWWWRATRVLPGTITEFPAFSLILGDLHAHLIALPLGVVALALAVTTFQGETPPSWRSWLRRPQSLLLCGLLYGGLVMTNSWDVVLYGAVWFAAAMAALAGAGRGAPAAALGAVRYMAPPALVALLAAAPFLSSIEGGPFALRLVTGAASDPLRLALVWLPLAAPLTVAALALRPRLSPVAALRGVALASALPLAWTAAVALSGQGDALRERGSGWIVLAGLVLLAGTAGAASAAAHRDGDRATAAWTGLAGLVGALLLVTELVRIDDAMGNRVNTVFKFWFGAWLLMAAAGGAALAAVMDRAREARPGRRTLGSGALVALAAGALLYGGSLLYAPAAAISRAREGQQPGLDALAYLERDDPGQAAALRWVQANLEASSTLLEAVGRAQTRANLLSAASGVPTLLGWPAHEYQWRGGALAIAERRAAVESIYREGASEQTRVLALSWGVTHVYLGLEERRQFGADVAVRFDGWPVRFESRGARIVEVPR